jgi:hypothetical protein
MNNNPSPKEINEAKNLNPQKYKDFTFVELMQFAIAVNHFNIIFGSPKIIENHVKLHTQIFPIFNRRNLIGYDFRII